MKFNMTVILAALFLFATSAFAESDYYIPCALDDFNSNSDEVISNTNFLSSSDHTAIQNDEDSYLLPDICETDEVGELGW